MAARLGPRFGGETAAIVAVAVVGFLLQLEWPVIAAAVLTAWLVVAIVEYVASRRPARMTEAIRRERPPVAAPAAEAQNGDARDGVGPASGPREWNVSELERAVQRRGGDQPDRDAEWGYLLRYLRQFAAPDGTLPRDFDGLVREEFADVIEAR